MATIRRLSTLLDTADNFNEHVWFWTRGLIFWGWKEIPQELIDNVTTAQRALDVSNTTESTDCEMIIPAKVVVWMKKGSNDTFDAIPCQPHTMAGLNIFMCEDMVTDHMPEQYEDALDALLQEKQAPTCDFAASGRKRNKIWSKRFLRTLLSNRDVAESTQRVFHGTYGTC
jgi:hypothetical protein